MQKQSVIRKRDNEIKVISNEKRTVKRVKKNNEIETLKEQIKTTFEVVDLKTREAKKKQIVIGKKAKQEILDRYTKRMKLFVNLSSGIVKTGNLHKGEQCITVETLENQDVLQECIASILTNRKNAEIEQPEHLFNMAFKRARIKNYRKYSRGNEVDENGDVSKFICFDSRLSEVQEAKGNGNIEYYQNFRDTLKHIYSKVKPLQKMLFNWAYLKGFTCQEIADKLKTNKMQVSRELKKLHSRLLQLNIKELFDTSFASALCRSYDYTDSNGNSVTISKPEKMVNYPAFSMKEFRNQTSKGKALDNHEIETLYTGKAYIPSNKVYHSEETQAQIDWLNEIDLAVKQNQALVNPVNDEKSNRYGKKYKRSEYIVFDMDKKPVNNAKRQYSGAFLFMVMVKMMFMQNVGSVLDITIPDYLEISDKEYNPLYLN